MARLNSPRRSWAERMAVLTHSFTRPLRNIVWVWLRPVRKKWNNRSSVQRLSYGLLALGIVMIVVGAAVILPNMSQSVQRADTTSGGEQGDKGITNKVGQSEPDQLIAPCGDPAIWTIVDQAVPGAIPGGVLCSLQWMAIQLVTEDPASPFTAYLGAADGRSWSLVAVSSQDGETIVGDPKPVPRAVIAASAEL